MISILLSVNKPININQLHILDFYYLFPDKMKEMHKFPRANTKKHKCIQNIPDSYELIENSRRVFFEIMDIRHNAIINLLSKNIISNLGSDEFVLNTVAIPEELMSFLNVDSFRKTDIFEILTKDLVKIKVNGENGLKFKSGLMEYRYD